jgi:Tc5 transposase DNA-binding domain
MLALWVSNALLDGIILTGEVLQQKWIKFVDLAEILMDKWLSLSEGWLTRFKNQKHTDATSIMCKLILVI